MAALPSGVLSEVAEHQFPGGLNVRDDTVAPAVVAAHIRKVIEGIVFTQADAGPRGVGPREGDHGQRSLSQ